MRLMSGIERWGGPSALMILLVTKPGALPQAGIAAGLWPLHCAPRKIPLPPLAEQRRIVAGLDAEAELDAEAAQMEAVRALLPRFEAKIQRVLDRVWGNGTAAEPA